MLYVFGDIIADRSVTTCKGPCQTSVCVCKADRSAVKLEFTTEREWDDFGFLSGDAFCCPVCERLHFRNVICVTKGKHRITVRMLLEFFARLRRLTRFRDAQVTADFLRRGVRSNQFRILCLKCFKLLEKHVEVVIAHHRHILHVVPSAGLVQNVPELLDPDIYLLLFHKNNNLQN